MTRINQLTSQECQRLINCIDTMTPQSAAEWLNYLEGKNNHWGSLQAELEAQEVLSGIKPLQ
jgi:hypothetical protein